MFRIMVSQDWPKARGARSNPQNRFDRLRTQAADDGWDHGDEGEHARLLAQRFHAAVRKLGLEEGRVELDCSKFKPPPRVGDQLGLW